MNIFWLDNDPATNARYHCDKHIVKMIVEYAQLLSTAHRVLDGTALGLEHPYTERTVKVHLLPEELVVWDEIGWQYTGPLYKATHINHPCAIWSRANRANYTTLVGLLDALCREYAHRYNKVHMTERLLPWVAYVPWALRSAELDLEMTPRPRSMPEQYHHHDVVQSYRNYYNGAKSWATWTNRPVPDWFIGA